MYTILVVEDNPDNMALLEDILEDEGYRLLKAVDAEQGIRVLAEHQVNLILMDISLPTMSGLDATKIIKHNPSYQAVPIVALTAFAMESDRTAALAAGCDDFLTKPINEAQLINTIHRFLRNYESV